MDEEEKQITMVSSLAGLEVLTRKLLRQQEMSTANRSKGSYDDWNDAQPLNGLSELQTQQEP